MKDFFYFTKGQRRGILFFVVLIIIAVLMKWGI